MKGIELCKKYYEQFGAPMLAEQFANVLPYLAVGLTGSGSECLGFDDVLSQDHDFEPAFCIFLPEEDIVDERTAFRLERAYAKLPREFMGYTRQTLSPVGGARHGVIRMGDFFEARTGRRDGALTLGDWLSLPEQALLEAVDGEIFEDHYGAFTHIRETLAFFPEDVRRKKLAGHLIQMEMAGRYNYPRLLSRSDKAAAQLALNEFVDHAVAVSFLLNRTYRPYYKWTFRALREFAPQTLTEELEGLLCATAPAPAMSIERVCTLLCDTLKAEIPISLTDNDLQALGLALNDTVRDNVLRSMHVLSAL